MSQTLCYAKLYNATVALLTAARLWLKTNGGAVGDKWSKKLDRELKKVESSLQNGRTSDPAGAMATALWLFNVVSTMGVWAHIGPQGLRVVKVPEHLDRATTLLLFVAIYDV
ncbi:hypothetical protein, partial [Infirmifilum sp.]|uniref:hypothetical protein n=1 Tax=Infirmifilum sp. TaxID=2856575 RepID=UPI003D1494F5